MSREISDLCEFSDLLLYVSCFASQRKGAHFGNYFFDVGWVNNTFGYSQMVHNKQQYGNT